MIIDYKQIASELSFIRDNYWQADWVSALHYCKVYLIKAEKGRRPNEEVNLLYDVMMKTLLRGERPFVSYSTEQIIIKKYGAPFGVIEKNNAEFGKIEYEFDPNLGKAYLEFKDVLSPWDGSAEDIDFDPEHPDNERKLFYELIKRFGSKIAHCIETQVDIANILNELDAKSFVGQRADLLLSFPNGNALVLEPGDHYESQQILLDKKRDDAFAKKNIRTFRPENHELAEDALYERIRKHIIELKADGFIENKTIQRTEFDLASNYLFLLPSLITRLEWLLIYFWFKAGLFHKEQVNIGILERDLECAELGVLNFIDRLMRLAKFFSIDIQEPKIKLYIKRNLDYRFANLGDLGLNVTFCDNFVGLDLDLLLDVSIKSNCLSKHEITGARNIAAVRQTYAHNRPVRFGYLSRPKPVDVRAEPAKYNDLLNSFVRDFFRKKKLRPGQDEVIHSIIMQKSTIGLLPTSAGKSICYQLASLLTPGTTIIIDPIIALMDDQVQSLTEFFGINRISALHSGTDKIEHNMLSILNRNLMVFISPERLLRPAFRSALESVQAADVYINHAVIDEAHCVSMWGHDFRPSYLMLKRNIESYCTFQGRAPIVVALTGTASQLVLIDLKRELEILELDSIVRPKTFDRKELNFNLVKSRNDDKKNILAQVVKEAIARRLNVQRLETDAYGIIFAHTPKLLLELMGQYVGDSKYYISRANAAATEGQPIHYGLYSGAQPKGLGLSAQEWKKYKTDTLALFKRGRINVLFGNTAVAVGIDNEKLNYIINYQMPQSMEAYYQQCGRAGRAGQHSECYLVFSDDAPAETQKWLNRETVMPTRWDDMGIVSWFHLNSFPGEEIDIEGAYVLFEQLFKLKLDRDGRVNLEEYFRPNMKKEEAERTERYISYWMIIGILDDYEVTGSESNTIYRVKFKEVVEGLFRSNVQSEQDRIDKEKKLENHTISNLRNYIERYHPISRDEIMNEVQANKDEKLSKRCIRYLVNFIYTQIEKRRRAAIWTMVDYCNQPDTSPENLRSIIKAYFDSSEKFSKPLMALADKKPTFNPIANILDVIEGFDDIEQLYWETRRFLDDRFRADWAAANLYAVVYRSKGKANDYFYRLFDDIIVDLRDEHYISDLDIKVFIIEFISYMHKLDTVFVDNSGFGLQKELFIYLYQKYGTAYTEFINQVKTNGDIQEIHLGIVNLQLKEINNARYSRIVG